MQGARCAFFPWLGGLPRAVGRPRKKAHAMEAEPIQSTCAVELWTGEARETPFGAHEHFRYAQQAQGVHSRVVIGAWRDGCRARGSIWALHSWQPPPLDPVLFAPRRKTRQPGPSRTRKNTNCTKPPARGPPSPEAFSKRGKVGPGPRSLAVIRPSQGGRGRGRGPRRPAWGGLVASRRAASPPSEGAA